MQKHRTKRNRKPSRMANANYEISEAAKSSIRGIVDSIDGGEDPALSYLREEFLTKFCDESLVPASERRANAIRKFMDCEGRNAQTNQRFVELHPEYNVLGRVTIRSFLRFVRRFIRDVLGPLHDGVVLGSFSGGASTSRPRTRSHPALKFIGKADITEGAEKFLDIIYREMPLLRQYEAFNELNIVNGSVLFTVPKKTDIDRCACKEPDINMFLQKGVGAHIRRRLRRFGINLNDQSRNRVLAQYGSATGTLATMDLSSASDTISREVVKALLPPLWFEYLDDIRSHTVEVDGETHRMEMFSSMGNGFTFELESLIFLALMRGTAYFTNTPGIVSIYGDDIIIPSGMFDDASWVLSEFGFSVNADKSYSAGPFRESCGGHFYSGHDITPFYLKREATRLTDVIRVCNQLRRWAFADSSRRYEHPSLYQVWYSLAAYVPKALWGGYDYNLDTKLVSPPGGSHKLVRVKEKLRLDDTGAYLLWHNSNWSRSSLPVEGEIKPESTNQTCRLRRSKPGTPVCQDLFFQELV